MRAVMFWSGGKDSALALYHIKKQFPALVIISLVTTLNSRYKRISMHGVREELLDRQAASLGLPLYKMWVPDEPSNRSYEKVLHKTLAAFKEEGLSHVIFGDIFLDDLRLYRDSLLRQHELTGIYPLWKKDTALLIREFIDLGFRTLTCCINTAQLDESWLGNEIDQLFIGRLEPGTDPCGENGEYHTFCFDGPVFTYPVHFTKGEKHYSSLQIKAKQDEKEIGFWYIDLIPSVFSC